MGNQSTKTPATRKPDKGTRRAPREARSKENTENIPGSHTLPPPPLSTAANSHDVSLNLPERGAAAQPAVETPVSDRNGQGVQLPEAVSAGIQGETSSASVAQHDASGTAKRGRKLTMASDPTSAESANYLDKALAAHCRRLELRAKEGKGGPNADNALTNAMRTLANYRLQRKGLDMGIDNDRLEELLKTGSLHA